MENPFYITGIIPEPYFCDREKETIWFVRTLENKAHILLTSPRRMGKTQLVRHVFEQPSIKDSCYTFYTDIYPTILEEKGRSFASIMNQLNYQQKETLIAIAKEGRASSVTSVAFEKKHALKSPSSVQYAISTLLEKQLLTYEILERTKAYSVSDRFLEMWISRTY